MHAPIPAAPRPRRRVATALSRRLRRGLPPEGTRAAGRVLRHAALGAALALAVPAVGQAASADLRSCMNPELTGAGLAETCRRAARDGANTPRERAAAAVTEGYALSSLGRHGDAAAAYDQAARIDAGFTPIYLNRALSRAETGDVRGALADFAEAVRREPRAAAPLLGRGGFYLRRGMALEALEDFESAERYDRDDPAAAYNRGLALAALDRPREAAQAFSRALRLAPRDASALLERGKAQAAMARPVEALRDFEEAAGLRPSWPDPWLEIGLLEERRGDGAAALSAFRRAFELGAQQDWVRARVQRAGG